MNIVLGFTYHIYSVLNQRNFPRSKSKEIFLPLY